MIILLIGVDSMKAPCALPLFMMATPSRCTLSFSTYTTFSPLCSVTDPVPFHLVSLIVCTWNPYSFISLATCPARVVSAMVFTFHQSMIVYRLGATMVPISLWASGWLWPNSVIAAPAATPPVSVVWLATLLTFSMLSDQRFLSSATAFFTFQLFHPGSFPDCPFSSSFWSSSRP